MKNLSILILIIFLAISLNGCRYINTQEPYLDAKQEKNLTIPDGVDTPNSTATLEVSEIDNSKLTSIKQNPSPPDMPIRTKQSNDGKVKISSEDGFPVLTVKTDVDDMWNTMNKFSLEDWSITKSDKQACEIFLRYDDSAAKERKKDGFIKKIFKRSDYYSNYSGEYKFQCSILGSLSSVKFSTADGERAKTYLADDVMNVIYQSFEN